MRELCPNRMGDIGFGKLILENEFYFLVKQHASIMLSPFRHQTLMYF